MSVKYELVDYKKDINVREFVQGCVDVVRIQAFCYNCPHYGKIWSCPPFDFDIMSVWNRYSMLRLWGRKIIFDKHVTQQHLSPDALHSIITKTLSKEKVRMNNELMASERLCVGSLALNPGRCETCEYCAKALGKDCIYPTTLRYSIEALGGDVCIAMERYFNQKIQWSTADKLPEYLFLVGALLKE